jgi:hypothetical protein
MSDRPARFSAMDSRRGFADADGPQQPDHRAGQKIEASWDVNRDGKIDELDVEEIARRSVAIR